MESSEPARIIHGLVSPAVVLGASAIRTTCAEGPPADVEAVVRGEDTFLILNAAPVVRPPLEHPIRVLTDALETRPVKTGTVLCREATPLQLRAVIYDFDAEDICTPDAIMEALTTVLRIVEERGICKLALPLLGTMHGYLDEQTALEVFVRALVRGGHALPLAIWLMVRAGSETTVTRCLSNMKC